MLNSAIKSEMSYDFIVDVQYSYSTEEASSESTVRSHFADYLF